MEHPLLCLYGKPFLFLFQNQCHFCDHTCNTEEVEQREDSVWGELNQLCGKKCINDHLKHSPGQKHFISDPLTWGKVSDGQACRGWRAGRRKQQKVIISYFLPPAHPILYLSPLTFPKVGMPFSYWLPTICRMMSKFNRQRPWHMGSGPFPNT